MHHRRRGHVRVSSDERSGREFNINLNNKRKDYENFFQYCSNSSRTMEPEIPAHRNVTIQALRPVTRKELSAALNPVKIILSKTRKPRYWYGLLDLCGIKLQYEADIQRDMDPTNKVLNLWYEKDPEHSTIQQLLLFLEEMDRNDVIEDITELIDEDIRVYKANPQEVKRPNLEADKYILTTDDVSRISDGRPLEIYDAFLLYDHDDKEFAIQMLEIMEKDYGMKFCVKDRDLVNGGLELDKVITVITERCNRVVVILSDSFFKSQANQYYLRFAQAYGIENHRNIIPCTYKECELSKEMTYIHILDYRKRMLFDFWGKLKESIEAPTNRVEKSRVNRYHSDNCHNLRSAWHENLSNGLKPANREVKIISSTGNLNTLVKVDQLVNPSTISSDNLTPFTENHKKEKNSWLKRMFNKNKNSKGKNKENKRAVAVAN